MIVCGWCESATEPGLCSSCGRDPALPWLQRNDTPPPAVGKPRTGRPSVPAGQIKQRLRLALKELGPSATNAQIAEKLEISDSTLRRWRQLAGL